MKRNILVLAAVSIMALSVTACGTDKNASKTKENTQQEQHFENNSESETTKDIASEAELTAIEKRDALEWEQLLDYSPQRQEELSLIETELFDNSVEIAELGKKVTDALKIHNTDNAVAIVVSDKWQATMLPKLVIGQRNYYWKDNDGNSTITIIADEYGAHYSKVVTKDADDKVVCLEVTDNMIHVFSCAYNEEADAYNGSFVSEYMELNNGNYVKNEGELSDAGKVNGELTVSRAVVNLDDGYISAWTYMENPSDTYYGEFDENGQPQLETPDEITENGGKAYAVRDTATGKEYLTVDSKSFGECFTGDMFGVHTLID